MIISMIVSLFAFEMQLESRVIVLQRKRFKADQLALAGIEMAKALLLTEEEEVTKGPTGERIPYEDPFMNEAVKLKDGLPASYSEKLGDGEVQVKVDFERGKRNIRTMTRDDWKLMFEQAGIPNSRWDSMIDCLEDWQDEGDEHKLNGAESDDSFYQKRDYECKNAPVDTVDELLLIKEWGEEVLYGTPADEESDEPITGIANLLTVWGDGKVNPNSAILEVLNTLPISERLIETIRDKVLLGDDLEPNSGDEGISEQDLAALGLDPGMFDIKADYVAVTSTGIVGEMKSSISCIFKLGEKTLIPLFWLEGKVAE